MENAEFPIGREERCENLRWKDLFVNEFSSPSEGNHAFWCLKTQIALGPDGAQVSHDQCGPGRRCYKPL
jgi:hypothetical protein